MKYLTLSLASLLLSFGIPLNGVMAGEGPDSVELNNCAPEKLHQQGKIDLTAYGNRLLYVDPAKLINATAWSVSADMSPDRLFVLSDSPLELMVRFNTLLRTHFETEPRMCCSLLLISLANSLH